MSASMHIDYGISISALATMVVGCPKTLVFLYNFSYAKLERSKLKNFDIFMVFKTQFPSCTFQLAVDSATLCAYIVHVYSCT